MIKRLILAFAGYAIYRWWNNEPARPEPARPVKRVAGKRRAVRAA